MGRLSAWHQVAHLGKWTNTTPDWTGIALYLNRDKARKVFKGDLETIKTVVEQLQEMLAQNAARPFKGNFFIEVWISGYTPAGRGPWMILGDLNNWRKHQKER